LAVGLVFCAGGFWLFGGKVAAVTYNLAAFSAVGFAWLAAWGWGLGTEMGTAPRLRARRWLLVAALLLPCNLVHVKTGIEIHQMVRTGTGLSAARRAAAGVLRPEDTILVNSGTWVLPAESLSMTQWLGGPVPRLERSAGRLLWIRPLTGSSREALPDEFKDWRPIFRFGSAERPAVFGIPVTKFGAGYSFEVLELVAAREREPQP
jgi:hypothetical protein